MKNRSSSRHETPRLQRSSETLFQFEASKHRLQFIQGEPQKKTILEKLSPRCWRLREVSKLPLGPCVVGKPPPARWWHRTPQIIPRWSFIQRILASFALNFATNRTDTDTPFFFSTGRTTRTEEKNQEHDEENSEVNQRSEELRQFKAFFWEGPMNFVPKTTCVFLVSKRFSLKKEINPSRKASNLSWSVKMTKKKTWHIWMQKMMSLGTYLCFFLEKVGQSSKLLY